MIQPAVLLARLSARARAEADLVALWAALLIGQALVPLDSPLGRDDLAPWFALCLGLAALLRARGLGLGAHPMLRPRQHRLGAYARRAALALTPVVLMGWMELARAGAPEVGLAAALGTLVVLGLRAIGATHGQTAWRPDARRLWVPTLLIAITAVVFALGLGVVQRLSPALAPAARAISIGLAFAATGLLDADPIHLRQRRAAGRLDGEVVRPELLPSALAFAGPALSWGVVDLLAIPLGGVDFSQAYVAALHVVVWAGALWPRPEPVAIACLLHEVVPAGGADPGPAAGARPFEFPPEGALRVSPIRVRRTRLIHPWIVPVRGARIARFDDPVRPLWAARPPAMVAYALGEARFEPDPQTHAPQRQVITIAPRPSGAPGMPFVLDRGASTSWRLVVLRARSRPRRRAVQGLYRWDDRLGQDAVQVIDPTTRRVELQDGDLIVVSADGVAYGYELELGAPIYERSAGETLRSPQIEDHVKAGGT